MACSSPRLSVGVRKALALVSFLALALPGTGFAQDDDLPTRVPETGLAILDCAPAAPAPEDSCVVRVPSDQTLGDLGSRDLGDEEASFRIVRNEADLPDGVILSSTLVLVDLSRGPGNGRVRTWAREREAIQTVIRGLPIGGEVAVYGFGADIQVLAGFARDRTAATDALNALELTENNTILTSNISRAITLLEGRETALFKNLIVVSDGDDEGVLNLTELTDTAGAAGVTLSALGMFWQSDTASSRGIDVLRRVTEPQNGLMQPVQLRSQAQTTEAVNAFVAQFGRSIGRSGLILPRGTPAAARITVEMNVPVLGAENETRVETYQVKFVPANVATDPEPAEEPEVVEPVDEGLIWGYPAMYVYIAAGIALLLLLLLLFLVLRGRGSSDEGEEFSTLDGGDLDGLSGFDDPLGAAAAPGDMDATGLDEPAPAPPSRAPSAPISAYLVRVDTGERLALRGDRISVGRSSSNGVSLPDQGVSRVHAELHRNREGGFSITDMDSLNGTFVNEKKVQATQQVRIGDTLGFGKVRTKLALP
jgi:hypothetical protein